MLFGLAQLGFGGLLVSFTTKAINVGEYALVLHEGRLTTQELNEARAKAIIILETNKWKRMLMDLRRASIDVNDLDLFHFTASHREKCPPDIRIAVVGNPKDHDKTSFADTVAHNQGVLMQTFDNWDQATEWLTKN
jgi:hypothetical protein